MIDIKVITINNKEKTYDVMDFLKYIKNEKIFKYYNKANDPIYINIQKIDKDSLTIRIFFEAYMGNKLELVGDDFVSQFPSFINSITLDRKNPIYEVDADIKAKILLLK